MMLRTIVAGLAVLGVCCSKTAPKQTPPDAESSAASYYEHVDKIVKDPEAWLARAKIKAHGYVVAGSIHQEVRDGEVQRTFKLQAKGSELAVRHTGPVPDTFKDNAEVVVSGHLVREGDALFLVADRGDDAIVAKCPSKYAGR